MKEVYNDILVYGQYKYLSACLSVLTRFITVTGEKFAFDSMMLMGGAVASRLVRSTLE